MSVRFHAFHGNVCRRCWSSSSSSKKRHADASMALDSASETKKHRTLRSSPLKHATRTPFFPECKSTMILLNSLIASTPTLRHETTDLERFPDAEWPFRRATAEINPTHQTPQRQTRGTQRHNDKQKETNNLKEEQRRNEKQKEKGNQQRNDKQREPNGATTIEKKSASQ